MSVKKCCVSGCNTKRSGEIPLHAFPNPQKHLERFQSWVNKIGGQVSMLNHSFIYRDRKVCHKHFEQRYLTWSKRLSPDAVPTLKLSGLDENKDTPPCKKIKLDDQSAEQQTECIDEYMTDEDTCKARDTIFGTPSHSYSDNKEKKYDTEKHAEYSCDHCLGDIIGFRYTCVQCDNFDLCGVCEGQLTHPHHYMLRVSKPRPFNELRIVIEGIRDKLKLLGESIKQTSNDWADVVIKKEEDPLEMETMPHAAALQQPLEVSIIPNADTDGSQKCSKQDPKSPKGIQNKNSRCSTSTAQSYIKINTANSRKRDNTVSTSDNHAIFVENDLVNESNLILTQKNPISNVNVFVNQNTAISDRDIRLHKESKYFSNINVSVQQNSKLKCLEQKQSKPRTNVEKYLQKDSALKKKSFKGPAMKNKLILIQNANDLKANNDYKTIEMFEEYIDEVWLDESILAEDNDENDSAIETSKKEFSTSQENNQVDNSKDSEETSHIWKIRLN